METKKSKSNYSLSCESGTTNLSEHQEMEQTPATKNGSNGEQSALSVKRSIPPFSKDRSYANCQTKETKLIDSVTPDFAGKAIDIQTRIPQNKTTMIEVPELRFIDKIEYDPFVIEKLRYVPKQVTKYNIIEKPVIKNIVSEKKVDVLYVQEKISFKDQEIVEEVYHYVDKDNERILPGQGNLSPSRAVLPLGGLTQGECDSSALCPYIDCDMKRNSIHHSNNGSDNKNSMGGASDGVLPRILEPFGPQVNITENKIFENVFVPKVEKVVEVKKKIDIPINLPVPYIVPKPKIVDVDIPVFKFNDKYVPVPVRQRIIPKVTWTDKVYKVDCVVEKPYLVYHDIVKIVPTDTKISVREYPKGITKINPEELYEVDNLALWMRVNADLKEEKDALKKTQDNCSDRTCECSNSDSFEECSSTSELNSSQDGPTTIKSSNENVLDTLPIHPGHPLELVHLQNKWLKQDTTRMMDLYQDNFFDAHRNAVFNLATRIPREAEIEVRQIPQLQRCMEKRECGN
ncbi:hypothetical protein C922_02415 [Plasmodium inui San Antonio 1]|uniref:Inner membrane complex protein 1b n=1 Tax=Plasmodium inui San Antonio 1 TaxID=1237626 RepID=W7A648_9APIC|nr:hypothetical protein C922_02415 [Plasmodium inui San Antonio 1]EUD67265.1 hypothetical protein C922_02415 [Plasmodium inui San Antonio 1]